MQYALKSHDFADESGLKNNVLIVSIRYRLVSFFIFLKINRFNEKTSVIGSLEIDRDF